MESSDLQTPIVFFIYKRPEQTLRVFQAIREAKPAKLYIIADGPKIQNDEQKCYETRKIIDLVDWDCTVKRDFSNVNLGLRKRIISGLDWVFEEEETAIVLEDDCLPHVTFFRYCEELLSYYKNDQRVMHISGDNFLFGRKAVRNSYYFSRVAHVWGWATWRRAWVLFHGSNFNKNTLDKRVFQNQFEKDFWLSILEQLRDGKQDYTWDYQWALTCMSYQSNCIIPNQNLVSNIGFSIEATHTKENTSVIANLKTYEMQFPLVHPSKVKWNNYIDRKIASELFHGHPIWEWDNFLSEFGKLSYRLIKRIMAKVLDDSK